MSKKIISAFLALTMLFMTACGDSSQADTSKADTTTTAVEQDNSEIDSSSDSEETTTTTAETTTTTSDTSSKKEEKSTTTTKATTKATTTTTSQATTTTKQAVVTTQATYTYKPVQTTKATTRATTKATTKATQATRATQPAKNKSALDLAYEAVILGTSTKAQRDLICNDLNNYVIAKGYSKKLDKSLYALSDANGKPVEDVTKAVGWGNCGYEVGQDNSKYTTSFRTGSFTLEKAREEYKTRLKEYIDINVSFLAKAYNKPFTNYRFNIVMFKETGNAVQRLDLKSKYNTPRYVMVQCYA